jgi:hypothetical protein
MWSNAFHQTLEFKFPDSSGTATRLFGFGIRRMIGHASGCWTLETRSGGCVEGRLRHGWIAAGGRLVGLCWTSEDGHRYACVLLTVHPGRARWRRLLVRLRVPMLQRLT